jgi:hypothetical protein
MLNPYSLVQAQVNSVLLQALVREFAADWLTNADSVLRDEGGKFAKKAAATGSAIASHIDEAGTKASTVQQVLKEAMRDPEAAKLKVSSELLKIAAKNLEKLVEKDPEFADKLVNRMFGLDAEKARDKLADMYADINPGLPNAIKPDPFKDIADDLKKLKDGRDPKELVKDFQRAFELTGYRYNKLIDDLNNVESESELIKKLGKLTATAIPISIYLAAVLTPEVAIGLMLRQRLTTILTFAAVGQLSYFLSNKIADDAGIENFWARLGIDFAVNLATGITLETAWSQMRSLKNRAATKTVEAIAPSVQLTHSLYEEAEPKFQDIVKMQVIAETMSQLVGLGIIGAISQGKKLADRIMQIDKELSDVEFE